MKIWQEKYQYLHPSQTMFKTQNCIKESFYACAIREVINSNFEGWNWNCTKNCFPSTLISSGAFDKKYACENYEQEACSYYSFTNYYKANCSKPCSIVQYNGKIDLWESWLTWDSNQNESRFAIHLRFGPPLTSTLYEEYLIHDLFGTIGSVGGTLGIFIGFSFSGVLGLITSFFKNLKRVSHLLGRIFY